MTDMTRPQIAILRRILGLTSRNRNAPTRNHSGGIDNDAFKDDLEVLKAKHYLRTKTMHSSRGKDVIYMATDAGRDAVLEKGWYD